MYRRGLQVGRIDRPRREAGALNHRGRAAVDGGVLLSMLAARSLASRPCLSHKQARLSGTSKMKGAHSSVNSRLAKARRMSSGCGRVSNASLYAMRDSATLTISSTSSSGFPPPSPIALTFLARLLSLRSKDFSALLLAFSAGLG